MVKEKERKTLNRIVEEGIYNIKQSDYEEEGNGDSKLRELSGIVSAVQVNENN